MKIIFTNSLFIFIKKHKENLVTIMIILILGVFFYCFYLKFYVKESAPLNIFVEISEGELYFNYVDFEVSQYFRQIIREQSIGAIPGRDAEAVASFMDEFLEVINDLECSKKLFAPLINEYFEQNEKIFELLGKEVDSDFINEENLRLSTMGNLGLWKKDVLTIPRKQVITIPENVPVCFNVTSKDYVYFIEEPELNIPKMKIVPNKIKEFKIYPDKVGLFKVFCEKKYDNSENVTVPPFEIKVLPLLDYTIYINDGVIRALYGNDFFFDEFFWNRQVFVASLVQFNDDLPQKEIAVLNKYISELSHYYEGKDHAKYNRGKQLTEKGRIRDVN